MRVDGELMNMQQISWKGSKELEGGLSQQNTKYEKVLKKPATFTLLEHRKEKSIKSERLKVGNSKREYVFR